MSAININHIEKMIQQQSMIIISDLIKAVDKANEVAGFDEYEDEYEETSIDTKTRVLHWAECFENESISIIGDDDDFHNIAVSYAKSDMYVSACIILRRGLLLWPLSIDLLADFIKYGTYCNPSIFTECEQYYNRLCSIPRREWNWRAFSFSLDYLMAKKKRNAKLDYTISLDTELENLSREFCSKENSDQAYYDRFTVLAFLGENDSAERALLSGTRLVRAPKCCLKMADLEFEKGNYDKANILLDRCWKHYSAQASINIGYALLLLAMSKASLFLENRTEFNDLDNDSIAYIKEIYKTFKTAEKTKQLTKTWKQTADTVISVLETQTGVMSEHADYEFG